MKIKKVNDLLSVKIRLSRKLDKFIHEFEFDISSCILTLFFFCFRLFIEYLSRSYSS